MKQDTPNDLFDMTTLGLEAHGIVDRLRDRPGRVGPQNLDVAPVSPDVGNDVNDEKQGNHRSASQRDLVGHAHALPRCVNGEREDCRQNDDEDETRQPREVGGAGTERDAPADHGSPRHMQTALEATIGAVRATPPATKAEFKGWAGGWPTKPTDKARAKPRSHRWRE